MEARRDQAREFLRTLQRVVLGTLLFIAWWGAMAREPLPRWTDAVSNVLLLALVATLALGWRLSIPPDWRMGRRDRALVVAFGGAAMATLIFFDAQPLGVILQLSVQALGLTLLASLYVSGREARQGDAVTAA